MNQSCSRRTVLVGSATVPVLSTLAGCRTDATDLRRTAPSASGQQRDTARGRLGFRPPTAPTTTDARTGQFSIPGADASDAEVYVPRAGGRPLRLVVILHGAGGVARSALNILRDEADEHRLLLVAPKSTATTWDVIAGGYGPDVRTIDRLMTRVAAAYPVRGFTIAGFSDGASYALTLGLTNGDVFDSVVAFSPGFHAARSIAGRPRIFVSHGTEDRVLPIDRCSRRIVADLEDDGRPVTYREFRGGHSVPAEMQRLAVEWLDEEPG